MPVSTIDHTTYPDAQIHEPKGAASASSGRIIKATGSATATFQTMSQDIMMTITTGTVDQYWFAFPNNVSIEGFDLILDDVAPAGTSVVSLEDSSTANPTTLYSVSITGTPAAGTVLSDTTLNGGSKHGKLFKLVTDAVLTVRCRVKINYLTRV
jgi:hypothetical protein